MGLRGRSGAALFGALIIALGGMGASTPARAHEAPDVRLTALAERIARQPRDAALYLERAELHRSVGDLAAAARDGRRALALDTSLDAALLALGRIELERGRPAKACRHLDRFLARRPEHATALAARARARAARGRHLDAASDYGRALRLTPPGEAPDPHLFLERSSAFAAADPLDPRPALEGLDEGIARLGPLVTLELAAVDLELRLGNPDGALRRLGRLAATAERQEAWLVRRGEILAGAGRIAEAAHSYRAALQAIARLPAARAATAAVRSLHQAAARGLARLTDPIPRVP